MRLMDYTDRISKNLTRNHNYIKKELVRNSDFEKLLKIRAILVQVNMILHKDYRPVAKTTLLGYQKIGLYKRKTVGAPPTILTNLLDTMRLHIKVQQISNKGKYSGQKSRSN